MFERILDSDPLTGVTELFQFDDVTKRCTIISSVDVEPLLEENKAQFNHFDERARWNRNQNRVASIPGILWAQMAQEGRVYDQKDWKRWLNDRDNSCFRTRPGRI